MGTCLVLPTIEVPLIPEPLSLRIEVALPALPDQPQFCCKLPDLVKFVKANGPQIPGKLIFGCVAGIAAFAVLNAYITKLNDWLRSIPLKCPLE